ncbi:hypothetical protein K474DRAFT_1663174 [Panus rudis PR-1116 ss-1]|nr:hypothetical protein K474DRAFT_1663174 [Panus rudis PR-1116 ss-1]
MRPRLPPTSGKHLELRLSKLIESGRSGHVYEADVLGVSSDVNIPTTPPEFPLPPLCIKLAEPNRLRSIAREAWFYEKTDEAGLQGIAVPRAFGFFTAECSLAQVIPWRERSWEFHDDIWNLRWFMEHHGYPIDWKSVPEEIPDELWKVEHINEDIDRKDLIPHEPEDIAWYNSVVQDDEHESNTRSSWKRWEWRICDPQVVGLIVMERLGEAMYGNLPSGLLDEKQTQEVVELLQDLAHVGVFHYYDARPCQFVEATSSSSAICPRHGYSHKWRVLDFDRCLALSASPPDREKAMKSISVIARRNPSFYSWC